MVGKATLQNPVKDRKPVWRRNSKNRRYVRQGVVKSALQRSQNESDSTELVNDELEKSKDKREIFKTTESVISRTKRHEDTDRNEQLAQEH